MVAAIAAVPWPNLHGKLEHMQDGCCPTRQHALLLPCLPGLTEAQALVNAALERLIRGQTRPGGSALAGDTSTSSADGAQSVLPAAKPDDTAHLAASQRRLQAGGSGGAAGGSNPVDMPVPLESCNWLNISACNATGGCLSSSWPFCSSGVNNGLPLACRPGHLCPRLRVQQVAWATETCVAPRRCSTVEPLSILSAPQCGCRRLARACWRLPTIRWPGAARCCCVCRSTPARPAPGRSQVGVAGGSSGV